LPESTQGALVGRTYQEDLGVALSLAVACPEDTAIAKATAEWLLNGKGLAHEALAARTILVHESSDPVVGQTARELLAVRQQLAQWTLRSPSIGQLESYRQRLEELARQEARLAQRVAQQTGRTAATGDWRELNSVRDRLPGGSALIDIVRFPVGDFRAHRFLPDHYAAWITPASTEGEVRFVDLGEAERIDELVEALRAALAAAPTAIRETGEPEANAALAQPLTDLARQVLHPILARIGDARHLILSPDAGLWLVPWAALPLPGDEGPDEARFLVEEYQIRYVRSGRDLWRRQRSDREPSESIVLADPDFDLGPTTSSRQTTVSADGDRPGLGIIHRRSRDHVLSDWIRLPGTATEARAIAPSIEQLTGAAPAVRLRADAQEAVVKAAHGPRVLVLSTHGFFLADQVFRTAAPTDSPDDSQPPMLTATGHPWENPLLRCGLVLAGANRRTDDRDDSREDGILTGLEIVGCDLRGTELVVLSACDTGVGDVRNGEGVAGLRQAFLLAGVQSVLATLWQIPDKETSRLMNDFFQNLAAGQSHAAALRNAQLTQIAARRERNGAAHPFFWAAFTQTGAE
jgi:CHAT domain-containing protein